MEVAEQLLQIIYIQYDFLVNCVILRYNRLLLKFNLGNYHAEFNFSSLLAGNYTISAQDNNGCYSANVSTTLVDPPSMLYCIFLYVFILFLIGVNVTVTQTNPICESSSSGSLTFTTSGGSGEGFIYSVCARLPT